MSIFSKLFGQKKSVTAKETVKAPPVFDNPTEQEINFDKLPDEQNQKKECFLTLLDNNNNNKNYSTLFPQPVFHGPAVLYLQSFDFGKPEVRFTCSSLRFFSL